MKRMLIVVVMIALLLPATVSAHSRLESSVPADGAALSASPERIELSFDTKIEKISTFKLFDSSNEPVEIGKTEVDGNKLAGSVNAALANGAYSVSWTIVGADGHVIDGAFSFTVDAPAPVVEAEEETAPSNNETPAPAEETPPAAEPSPAPEASASGNSGSETGNQNNKKGGLDDEGVLPFVLIGIVIVGILALALWSRKRK